MRLCLRRALRNATINKGGCEQQEEPLRDKPQAFAEILKVSVAFQGSNGFIRPAF
jgi:hypothetical protein